MCLPYVNGIVIEKLILEHNFEYPDFYPKLYRLLSDEVVYSPTRVKFLHMLDLFLASPLLPLQMQAAFTKVNLNYCNIPIFSSDLLD